MGPVTGGSAIMSSEQSVKSMSLWRKSHHVQRLLGLACRFTKIRERTEAVEAVE